MVSLVLGLTAAARGGFPLAEALGLLAVLLLAVMVRTAVRTRRVVKDRVAPSTRAIHS